MNPKVFISHASEDKERFVLKFALKLREKGIDAWVDKWEMYPGDSLVDKIFEEGIKSAQAMLVIVSKYSINKPWVREELNAGMVKRINGVCKLIPVIIDDCDVPECLHSTVWQKILNLENYGKELEEIIMAIYGQKDKPPLGKAPYYATMLVDLVPNLSKVDSLALVAACERAVETNNLKIETSKLFSQIELYGISKEELYESLEILANRGYIDAIRNWGSPDISLFLITNYGFGEYAKTSIKGYSQIVSDIAYRIVNLGETTTEVLCKSLNLHRIVVNHVLDDFFDRGLISIEKSMGGTTLVYSISVELRRLLRD